MTVREFRWRRFDDPDTDWSRWHKLTGACDACCCGSVSTCPECGDREHQEPGEPISAFDVVHSRMCQKCWPEEFDEPDGKVEER